MSARTLVLGWLGLSALLFSVIVLAVAVGEASALLKRWTTPPDPERQALDELERLYRMPAFRLCPARISAPHIDVIPCSLALGHDGLHQSGPAGPWRNVSWSDDVSPAWSAEGGDA